MSKKKRQDAFKAKERKQKMIAAGGGVILLILLAIQGPRVMKQLNRGNGAPAAVAPTVSTPTAGSPEPTLAAPTTLRGDESGASTATGIPSAGGASSGLITAPSPATQGQLASFSRFASKDPFAQQVSETAAAPSSSKSRSGSGGRSGSTGGMSTATGTSPGVSGGSGSSTTTAQPSPGSAVISVNGTLTSVAVGANFPQPTPTAPGATPLFHLISLTATSAKISIVGGTYTSGAGAVTLRVNKPVTLMNTADGSRYKLILKPQGIAVPGTGASGTTSMPTVTLPPASP
jgi:hypothetical protein